jgi:Zn-dependent peptidase ImmA (M78 family)
VVDIQFKYNVNNVPRLSDAEIERHALLFLKDYKPELLKSAQPLDVEDFAEGYMRLGFHYTNLSHNGFIWGRMVFNNTLIVVYNSDSNRAEEEPVEANTIVIDNSLLEDGRETVFRSSVMHECGHSVYHPEYYCIDYSSAQTAKLTDVSHMPYTSCKSVDIIGGFGETGKRKKLKTDHDWLEHHAKYFSAATLMNRTAMKALCKDLCLRAYCFEKHPDFVNDALIAVVAQKFGVSLTSARIRVRQLKLGYITEQENPSSFYSCGQRHHPLDVQYN